MNEDRPLISFHVFLCAVCVCVLCLFICFCYHYLSSCHSLIVHGEILNSYIHTQSLAISVCTCTVVHANVCATYACD